MTKQFFVVVLLQTASGLSRSATLETLPVECIYTSAELIWLSITYKLLFIYHLTKILSVMLPVHAPDFIHRLFKLVELAPTVAQKQQLLKMALPSLEPIAPATIIHIKTSRSNTTFISIDNFLFVEATGRGCIVHYLQNGIIKTILQSKTIGQMEDELLCFNLLRVHRRFLINLDLRHSYDSYNRQITLLWCEPIPVSRSLNPYMAYLLADIA